MPLTLLIGPANAGKVALLLDRYLEQIGRDPVLIVPNRPDVERVERELLERGGALVGGFIGTFDDLFERIVSDDPGRRPVATEAQRQLLVRRALEAVELETIGRSARFRGFADSLLAALGELGSGLVDPAGLGGDLARLFAAYRRELDRRGLWDRDLLRARAVHLLATDLGSWRGEPVFAYGFEDLTAVEWALVKALAGRTDVSVSLPYEPGRPVFDSLREIAEDLGALAGGRIEELPPRYAEIAHPALAHLERNLFEDRPHGPAPALEGAVRFLEGAGVRGSLELVAEEVLELLRGGMPAEQIAVVVPSLDRYRAPLETVFGTMDVPFAVEGRVVLARTPLGRALLSLLRFAWLGGGREDLFAYLRSPYSGLPRHQVDFLEGRLRGRAVSAPERVEQEIARLRGGPIPQVESLRAAEHPVTAVRELAAAMLEAAHGLQSPSALEQTVHDLRCHEAVARVLDELEGWERLDGSVTREEVVALLERAPVRLSGAPEPGRVTVLDLMRVRTRRLDAVFVLGLEEGSLPRRASGSPFLTDDERRRLGGRLQRPDPVARDRYLFYTACTRASQRLALVREAATDEGAPREQSPFWDEVRALFDPADVARWTRRRPLSALTWPLEQAPTERERLRALATLHITDPAAADALARANGWERRLERARTALARPTRLRHPLVLEQLGAKTSVGATELERFADCSSAWFVERFLDPKAIDAEVDAKLKGSVAHQALYKFFSGLPKELGTDHVDPTRIKDAVGFMRRCLDEALAGVRMDMTEMQRRELDQTLWRDLEALVRAEAESELALQPRRFEVLFGSERAAPELQRGLDLGGVTLSGKIDRIDVDPFSARGLVVDYKSGSGAHSAVEIEKELRLQIPLYLLVLRDLVGVEPLGGVYRPLGGARRMRGLLRAEARADLPGFAAADYLEEDAFWAQVENARLTAARLAERLRSGDVRHDPRGGECPSWCDLWPMCRVKRA